MGEIDFTKIKIELQEGTEDISTFDCGHDDITEFLKEDSIKQKEIMLNSTYIVKYFKKDNHIPIGFFTLCTDKISLNNLDEKYKEKFINKKISYDDFPALKIGRLGVTTEYQSKKIGPYILRWIFFYGVEMLKNIGIRFITIDSYLGNPYDFYKKNLCKDIYNKERLKKEFEKYERLKERNHPDANKRTVPLFMDLYKFKNLFSQEGYDF